MERRLISDHHCAQIKCTCSLSALQTLNQRTVILSHTEKYTRLIFQRERNAIHQVMLVCYAIILIINNIEIDMLIPSRAICTNLPPLINNRSLNTPHQRHHSSHLIISAFRGGVVEDREAPFVRITFVRKTSEVSCYYSLFFICKCCGI